MFISIKTEVISPGHGRMLYANIEKDRTWMMQKIGPGIGRDGISVKINTQIGAKNGKII